MPQRVPTSFVPKQPVRTVRRPQVKGPLNIFAVAALALLGAAIVLAGLVFGFEVYLKQVKSERTADLKVVQDSVDPQAVEELARLSQRLVIAKELLNNHVAVSAVFGMFERDTVQNISFDDFELQTAPSGDVELKMKGVAATFNALAYQAVVFRENPFLRNQLFGNITVTEEGDVTFTFEGIVSSTLVRAQGGSIEVAPNEALDALFNGGELPVDAEETAPAEEVILEDGELNPEDIPLETL
jgi:hypothetical protein